MLDVERKLKSNPCPICRDQNLLLHEENTDLLAHFYDDYTGRIFPIDRTQLCRKMQTLLHICINRSRHLGLMKNMLPCVEFNYEDLEKEIRDEIISLSSEQLI
ncbi:MAG: ribosomal protein S18B [Paramarteilia canceri]